MKKDEQVSHKGREACQRSGRQGLQNHGADVPDEQIDFEKALKELEGIVTQLEQGNLTLERSLELFERGVQLARQCKARLDAAQLRVSQLVKEKEGIMSEVPFEEEPEEER
ncbi:MAG: exodeoxyribonuclease VII small subunit [candidate division WOR-3 bacterium]